MKVFMLAVILVMAAGTAHAVSTLNFVNYSVAGGSHVPTTCSWIMGLTDANGIIQPSGAGSAILTTKKSTGSITFTGAQDYSIKCVNTATGAVNAVQMYFDSASTVFFPNSALLLRYR